MIPDLPESRIRLKSRLEPGKMFLVDFEKGEIISDNIIKEEVSWPSAYIIIFIFIIICCGNRSPVRGTIISG